MKLSKRRMTKDGKARKERIIDKLFYERRKTNMLISSYTAGLEILKEYTVLFQDKDPMIHILHRTNKTSTENWLPASEMFMGTAAMKIVRKSNIKDYIITDVLDRPHQAYANCAKMPSTEDASQQSATEDFVCNRSSST